MFRKRERGLAALEPLTGRCEPQGLRSFLADLHEPERGDLMDLRNRLGLLSPPCLRFVNIDLHLKPSLDEGRQKQLMEYLEKEYAMSSYKNKPYYVDPYERDRRGPVQMLRMLNRQPVTNGRPEYSGPKESDASARAKYLRGAMDQAQEKREEQREKDAKMWGKGGDEEELFTISRNEMPAVSPHLYQPREHHNRSEWTKNMELAMAKSRKKDIHDVEIRRLEQHQQHADAIRIAKDRKDQDRRKKLVDHLQEKAEKFAKFQRSKLKY